MKIAGEILRAHKVLHTWTGIVSGLLLFIGFSAGALTLFEVPLERWANVAVERGAPLWSEGDDSLVSQVLARHPSARKAFTLDVSPQGGRRARMTWQGGEECPGELCTERWQAEVRADGGVEVEKVQKAQIGQLIDLLHRTAGVPGVVAGEHVGVYVMGIASVLYFLAIVSGVILILPTLVRDLFALRTERSRKRFWLDAHNAVGIASLPFHIVISLTVIVFAFHDQFYDALSGVVYGKHPMFSPTPAAAEPYKVEALLPVTRLLDRVREEAPDFEITELLYLNLESVRPLVRVALENSREVVHGPSAAYLIVNPYSGEVLNERMVPGRRNVWTATVDSFFALHVGSFGGSPVRWMYFAMGLGGAFLFYSGNLLWLESRRRRQRAADVPAVEQSRSVYYMAALTVGVCLGSIIGLALCFSVAKLGPAQQAPSNDLLILVYYATFLSAVGWALYRGAARASVELLFSAGAAVLAMPISSVGALLMIARSTDSSLALLLSANLEHVAVDGAALVFAFIFLAAGKQTLHKVRRSSPDTIWYVSPRVAGTCRY